MIVMKRILFGLMLLTTSFLIGQQNAGLIKFDRSTYYINIMAKLPFLTQEDIDREMLTWGKEQGKEGQPYEFYFNDQVSVYTMKEDDTNYGYSWKEDDFLLIRDYKSKTAKDLVSFLGKSYLVESDIPRFKWKIQNEIKEIAGYLCMKAETIDPVKGTPIAAWFTDKIPIYGGPEGYGGLPGMILGLEMDGNAVIIEATEVQLSDKIELPIPKKMKGKKIEREAFNKLIGDYIQESIKTRRNPYWQIRY